MTQPVQPAQHSQPGAWRASQLLTEGHSLLPGGEPLSEIREHSAVSAPKEEKEGGERERGRGGGGG